MLKKDLPACPVELTLLLISNKWKVLIIRDLLDGTKRFSELKKSINNISQKVLTSNLREMEENNLLTRKVYPEVPPRVEYTLTDIGYSLKTLLDDMDRWGHGIEAKRTKNKVVTNKNKVFVTTLKIIYLKILLLIEIEFSYL